ncbi:MAG TPA: DUF1653 domain-containing protein [Candidatus Paceibacterota bacterium]|nr:DUF1653 domain-containing protein [Candidatus Paceibacterota bacterium]
MYDKRMESPAPLSPEAERIRVGAVYEHFKHKDRYRVVGIAHHSETLEEFVVYQHLGREAVWIRPVKMWEERVELDDYKGPRFRLVEEAPVG